MRLTVKRSNSTFLGEDFPENDYDVYAETLDDEEAIDMGLKPEEAAFMRGFKIINIKTFPKFLRDIIFTGRHLSTPGCSGH